MTQVTFTISSDTNPSIIRNILENIKGILVGSISIHQIDNSTSNKEMSPEVQKESMSHSEYMSRLKSLIQSIDKTAIDHTDEKTRYILSK